VRLDKKILSEINVSGYGSGEKAFGPALIGFRRVDETLYDFVNDQTQEKVELKKQQGTQWFDGWKYHDLTPDDRKIVMMFLVYKKKTGVEYVWSISLGDFIDILLDDNEYSPDGWEVENLAIKHMTKQRYKTEQSKLKLSVKKFVNKHGDRGTFHYQKSLDI
jgi:hypothetical protein